MYLYLLISCITCVIYNILYCQWCQQTWLVLNSPQTVLTENNRKQGISREWTCKSYKGQRSVHEEERWVDWNSFSGCTSSQNFTDGMLFICRQYYTPYCCHVGIFLGTFWHLFDNFWVSFHFKWPVKLRQLAASFKCLQVDTSNSQESEWWIWQFLIVGWNKSQQKVQKVVKNISV